MSKEGMLSKKEQQELINDLRFLKENFGKLMQENLNLKEEIQKQKDIVSMLQKMVFGPKTEKAEYIHPDQLLLFSNKGNPNTSTVEKEEQSRVAEHQRKKRKKRGAGKQLPIVLKIIDLPEEEKIGADGKPKIQVGYVDTDKVEHAPEKLYIYRIRRLKYIEATASKDKESGEEKTVFSIPPLPADIAPKSIFTPSLLSYLIVIKFLDALPLNRIEKRFLRYGYELSKATMVNGLLKVAKKCEVLTDLLLKEALRGSYLLMDETTFQVHKEHGRANKSKSYIWVMYGGPPDKPIIIFKYHTGREKEVPLLYLRDYKGFLQSDGYEGYNDAGELPDIIHALCWVHARRYFIKAFEQSQKKDNLANEALELIKDLFKIEKRLKKAGLSEEEFLTQRRKEVEPVFASIKAWCEKHVYEVAPKSLLGKAIGYTLKHWDKLIKYIECPYLTPSTNRVENIIRTVVLGRKNYLFFGSPRGAYAGMTFYSLIETARANGLEPSNYLKYIFTRLPYASTEEEYKKLLPQYLDADDYNQFDMEKASEVTPTPA